MKDKTELELIWIAELDVDDLKANAAMKELRGMFDETYGWCNDCDGLVVKYHMCCMNYYKPVE